MINLLTSASRFLNDTENFNSTTDKLLSSLFDGFIFYSGSCCFYNNSAYYYCQIQKKSHTRQEEIAYCNNCIAYCIRFTSSAVSRLTFSGFFATLTTISQATISLPLYREQANMQYMCRTISL